jgi:hypothetical protein
VNELIISLQRANDNVNEMLDKGNKKQEGKKQRSRESFDCGTATTTKQLRNSENVNAYGY